MTTIKNVKITLITLSEANIEIGLRIISAYLKDHGYQVDLLFLGSNLGYTPVFELFPQEVADAVIDRCKDSDLIGFSLMTNYFIKVRDLTIKIKKALDIPIIWGGIHPTAKPEECLAYADFVCIGEGEEAMLELSANLKYGDIYNIKNIWLNRNGKIIKNEVRPLEENLDKYPFQDYDISTHYVLKGNKIDNLSEDILEEIMPKHEESGKQTTQYLIHTIRGCPHNCTYCTNSAIRKVYHGKGKYVRPRSYENVIREIESIRSRFSFIKRVLITDDTFFVRTEKEIADFCSAYKKRVNLPMKCYLSPQTMSDTKLKHMIGAGLDYVSLGVQSFNSETLKNIYERPTSKELISEAIRIIDSNSSRLSGVQYHIIVDNPYESKKSKRENLQFILSLPYGTRVSLFPLTLFPGTELYQRAKKDGLIIDEINEIYLKGWTIDHVKRLDYLTYLLYLAKWSKVRRRFKRVPMEKIIWILAREEMVFLFDNDFSLRLIRVFRRMTIKGVGFLRRIKKNIFSKHN